MFNIFSLKAHGDKNLLSETQVGVLGKCHGIDCLVYEMCADQESAKLFV